MPSILVLCPDNTCLSKMAEAYLRFFAQDEYDIFSAGLRTDIPIDPACLSALASDNLELNSSQTQDVRQFTDRTFDYLLTLNHRPDFAIPANLRYKNHRHYQVKWPAETPHEQSCQMVVEEVKRAVLHYIGSSLRVQAFG